MTAMVWDWMLMDGFRVLFKVAFAILEILEDKLISLEGSEILNMLNNVANHLPGQKEFMKIAKKVKVSKHKFAALIEAYKSGKKLSKTQSGNIVSINATEPETILENELMNTLSVITNDLVVATDYLYSPLRVQQEITEDLTGLPFKNVKSMKQNINN